jgi:hypothetical protein
LKGIEMAQRWMDKAMEEEDAEPATDQAWNATSFPNLLHRAVPDHTARMTRVEIIEVVGVVVVVLSITMLIVVLLHM